MQPKKSEADWAVDLLVAHKEPIHYIDLLKQICKKMGRKTDSPTLTSMYTRLNLDNRLIHQGDGYWFYDTGRIHPED